MTTKTPAEWTLAIEVQEDDQHCDMVVTLDTGAKQYSGTGRSRRNPADPNLPRVGEELAAARALHDLANALHDDAWAIIEGFTHANA